MVWIVAYNTISPGLKAYNSYVSVMLTCECQRAATLPVNLNSFQLILRSSINVPAGRSLSLIDIIIRHYGSNSTTPKSYQLAHIKRLLTDPEFDLSKSTVLYAHGYVELTSDESVRIITTAYMKHGGYNVLVLDWSNMAFGNYLNVALDITTIGKETAKAIGTLLNNGLSLESLHFVGHSLGTHLLAGAARTLSEQGFRIPRITGLDPAYPGFYPPILGTPLTSKDAKFVDIIHTDGGGYGAPTRTGHADFWPNGGQAKQPGCLSATVPLTIEDFCSHWRSWAFWAESVAGGEFFARKCEDYDAFLRGQCKEGQLVRMGLQATPDLRGNFYLRTAAKPQYSLQERGAE
ncbi:hypothetical protein K1T71_012000 [Dendrolimus kikuchii]|uniref:Uncharacterized protein n=1 Tax=Dendrolimus kikuchii TaxID=765133 RepID=A0ACC1CKM1_9NEOP|nr:hypothetical protein K1T71_012000 [Dendrolimus kikuchii]